MSSPTSPFRLLTRTYTSQILTREEYVQIRAQLLKKLQAVGTVSEEDLKNITNTTDSSAPQKKEKSYSLTDWIIIALGLAAAVILGFVLYS
ncbi:MAG: hypothetical protein GY820_29125 [Gammaproteobacteria bacterium]|nr:hypothetical protein [Gammaproteobacteria bacterium]